jgi:hypothetical protein
MSIEKGYFEELIVVQMMKVLEFQPFSSMQNWSRMEMLRGSSKITKSSLKVMTVVNFVLLSLKLFHIFFSTLYPIPTLNGNKSLEHL